MESNEGMLYFGSSSFQIFINGWKLELPDTPEAPASKYLLMAGSRSFQVHQNSSFQIFINDWKLELPGTPKLQLPNIY
jgi:nitrogen fixation protein